MTSFMTKSPKFHEFVLEPETVVDAVIEQVLKGEGAQIILPERFKYVVGAVRMLPLWMQEMIRDGQHDMIHV